MRSGDALERDDCALLERVVCASVETVEQVAPAIAAERGCDEYPRELAPIQNGTAASSRSSASGLCR